MRWKVTPPKADRDDLARDLEREMREVGDAIVAGVERELPGWVRAQVARIADAWGRLDDEARTHLDVAADQAADVATERIVRELRALLDADAAEQRATPLQVVRTAYREPTGALAAAGIPPIERDAFDERAWPDDAYGLVPHTLGDLGDPDLAPMLLAWGMAKTAVLRDRSDTHPRSEAS
jgi:hypothetical protein